MLESFIKQLEKQLNIPLVTEEHGTKKKYFLTINDGSELSFEEEHSFIFISSNISPFNEKEIKNVEDFYIYLSQANYLGQGTGNSVISIDPDEKFLTLSTLIAYEVNYKMFFDWVEEFVNYLSYWKKEVNNKIRLDK
jgi:hypothetical protein